MIVEYVNSNGERCTEELGIDSIKVINAMQTDSATLYIFSNTDAVNKFIVDEVNRNDM